jgi:hypothetical protein
MLRIGFELDPNSLGLQYNDGAPHVITYDNLIAIGAQGKPAGCAGDQGVQVVAVSYGEERP